MTMEQGRINDTKINQHIHTFWMLSRSRHLLAYYFLCKTTPLPQLPRRRLDLSVNTADLWDVPRRYTLMILSSVETDTASQSQPLNAGVSNEPAKSSWLSWLTSPDISMGKEGCI